MKQLLITLITLAASSIATASNGSGTMGIDQRVVNGIDQRIIEEVDLVKTPVIKYDGVSGDKVEISKLVSVTENGEITIDSMSIDIYEIDPDLRKLLNTSAANNSWEIFKPSKLSGQ